MAFVLYVASSLTWCLSSSAIIIINKRIMAPAPAGLGFFFPLMIAFMGAMASTIFAVLTLAILPPSHGGNHGGRRRRDGRGGARWAEALAVSACFAVTLWCGNAAYETLSVSFVQMLKSATPLVTLLVATVVDLVEDKGMEKLRVVLFPTSMIAAGTLMASIAEVKPHPAGICYFFVSSLAESFRVVLTQRLLKPPSSPDDRVDSPRSESSSDSKLDGVRRSLGGMRKIAPITALLLGIAILVSHERAGLASRGFEIIADNAGTFAIASVLGFIVNVSTNLFLSVSSGLTFKVFGATKNAVVVVLGCVIFKETTSLTQIVGYATSIAGFFVYTSRLKSFESAAGKKTKMVTKKER